MTERPEDDVPSANSRGVGYRRPPLEHQFKPGASGNPAGRPKGSPTFQDLVEREARRRVTLKTAHGVSEVPKLEALVRRLYAMALDGDMAAMRLLIQCLAIDKAGDEANLEEPIDPSKIDDEALRHMLARFEKIYTPDASE
ncbi:MAG TPA: DUF5681 domain-containing protein [Devosia sp.]|nr:DUF5681 domain-containing protein [Devosia sp.]